VARALAGSTRAGNSHALVTRQTAGWLLPQPGGRCSALCCSLPARWCWWWRWCWGGARACPKARGAERRGACWTWDGPVLPAAG
jgi:hypothetical protein